MRKFLFGLVCAALFLTAPASNAAEALKILGQVNPAATTATDLYTVPAATSAVVSTMVIANQAGTQATFRISIRVAGASANAKQYLAYDVAVPPNDSIILTLGVALGTGDVITVYGSSTSLSFTATGSEIS